MPRRAKPSEESLRIGRRIRSFRRQRLLTQSELAERCRMAGPSQISDVERGAQLLTVDTLNRIARGLGIPTSLLIADPNRHSLDRTMESYHRLPAAPKRRLGREIGAEARRAP